MKRLTVLAALAASPAAAATGPFVSLNNTDFVVLIAFLIFLGILFYYKVPSKIAEMLDKRAEGIKADLAEAKSTREEAQTLLASYERKHKDVQEQADRIVAGAREEARLASEKAQDDLKVSIERRLAAAQDQIASAESSAVQEVRDRAVQVAIAAAAEVLAKQMDASRSSKMIDESINTVEAKLH